MTDRHYGWISLVSGVILVVLEDGDWALIGAFGIAVGVFALWWNWKHAK